MPESSPFQLHTSHEVYQNPWIRVREDRVTRPDGNPGIFGVVEMQPGVTILAVTLEGDTFLVREYRYAVARWSLELPSGGLDAGDTPETGAIRELEEETGYRAGRIISLGTLDPFTTVIRSENHMVLALDLEPTMQRLEGSEILSLVRMPLVEAVRLALRGEITHGASCALLLKAPYMLPALGVTFDLPGLLENPVLKESKQL